MVNAIQKPFSRMAKQFQQNILVRKTFVEVATQHLCGFMIDHVSEGAVCQVMSSFVDKLTFFCLGIMILDGNV